MRQSNPERRRHPHFVLRTFIRIPSLFVLRRAHQKLPRRDHDHLRTASLRIRRRLPAILKTSPEPGSIHFVLSGRSAVL
jgi:hypothetical protein